MRDDSRGPACRTGTGAVASGEQNWVCLWITPALPCASAISAVLDRPVCGGVRLGWFWESVVL